MKATCFNLRGSMSTIMRPVALARFMPMNSVRSRSYSRIFKPENFVFDLYAPSTTRLKVATPKGLS
ncbi:hypothetical protein RchiOBHm_Chr1g0328901 [Rosa chinensis]|uniref:Uncharacterized protein n=1 Tax=Rosa chinensis TaxID=74649 RepID=A0A2P6SAY3_ROSCH|nr:hypothetical protein RchiOBHm_Chr1g0328901 [Rosa chinensis]